MGGYAECLDPYDYAWKLYQLLPDPPQDSLSTAYGSWFACPPRAIPTLQDRV